MKSIPFSLHGYCIQPMFRMSTTVRLGDHSLVNFDFGSTTESISLSHILAQTAECSAAPEVGELSTAFCLSALMLMDGSVWSLLVKSHFSLFCADGEAIIIMST